MKKTAGTRKAKDEKSTVIFNIGRLLFGNGRVAVPYRTGVMYVVYEISDMASWHFVSLTTENI